MALRVNDCFRCPGSEVIIVIDTPGEEKEIMDLVKENEDIKFRVILNDWPHPWRPPCIPINVGVRHASAPHICVTSPETMITTPGPNYFEEMLGKDWRSSRGSITCNMPDVDPNDSREILQYKILRTQQAGYFGSVGCGFLLCQKSVFESVCGFDERRAHYGGDDDDIRIRMLRMGTPMIIDPNITVFHPWHHTDTDRPRAVDPYPGCAILYHQQESWGRSFNRVLWDWNKL